jgi:hypothetical protein
MGLVYTLVLVTVCLVRGERVVQLGNALLAKYGVLGLGTEILLLT